MDLISDLRLIVYEYADIFTIADYYDDDSELFDKIIQKAGVKTERQFSLINLTYLKKNDIKMKIIMNEVVSAGKLANIKYMKEQEEDFDQYTFFYAIVNGNFENMDWLHKNDCHIGRHGIEYAIMNNKTKILDWYEKNGYLGRHAYFKQYKPPPTKRNGIRYFNL
jgi:hypothetical protein